MQLSGPCILAQERAVLQTGHIVIVQRTAALAQAQGPQKFTLLLVSCNVLMDLPRQCTVP